MFSFSEESVKQSIALASLIFGSTFKGKLMSNQENTYTVFLSFFLCMLKGFKLAHSFEITLMSTLLTMWKHATHWNVNEDKEIPCMYCNFESNGFWTKDTYTKVPLSLKHCQQQWTGTLKKIWFRPVVYRSQFAHSKETRLLSGSLA